MRKSTQKTYALLTQTMNNSIYIYIYIIKEEKLNFKDNSSSSPSLLCFVVDPTMVSSKAEPL